jgi:hypothetical protein
MGFGTTVALTRVAPARFGARRPRPALALAPVAARAMALAALVSPRRRVLFAGKISVGVFARLFLHPGREELQIKKIRRVFFLGHESLYATAHGCKIAAAFWHAVSARRSAKYIDNDSN